MGQSYKSYLSDSLTLPFDQVIQTLESRSQMQSKAVAGVASYIAIPLSSTPTQTTTEDHLGRHVFWICEKSIKLIIKNKKIVACKIFTDNGSLVFAHGLL